MSFKKKLKKVASLTAASALITGGSLLINSDPANATQIIKTSNPATCTLNGRTVTMKVSYETNEFGIVTPLQYMITTPLPNNNYAITRHTATLRNDDYTPFNYNSENDIYSGNGYMSPNPNLQPENFYTFWTTVTARNGAKCTTNTIKIDQ